MNGKVVKENVLRNGQPNDGREVIIEEARAPIQVRMVARNGPSRPGKRPIKNVSPREKVSAIERVHEGESKASVARDIGVPESTLRGWCKSEHKIRSQCGNLPPPKNSPANTSTAGSSSQSPRSSEEDGPATKKAKLDRQNSSQDMMPGTSASSSNAAYMNCVDSRNINVCRETKASLDYASLVASTMASISPEQSHIALQQLSLLSPHLTKNLLGISALTPTVGLVENGLQYRSSRARMSTMGSSSSAIGNIACGISDTMGPAIDNSVIMGAMGNAIDHSIGNKHMAIAPAQMTTRPGTRKSPSVSPAAEAPSTPVPASPNENNAQPSTSRARHSTGSIPKIEDGMWTWLHQQQRMFNGRQSTGLPPINLHDGSGWFWQWWKTYNLMTGGQSATPEQARAILDAVLAHNTNNSASDTNDDSRSQNNERHHRSIQDEMRSQSDMDEAQGQNIAYEGTEAMQIAMNANSGSAGIEDAIQHGDMLLEWLDNCSIPRISRMQIVQFKCLLDTLKLVRDLPPRQSRRQYMESAAYQGHHM